MTSISNICPVVRIVAKNDDGFTEINESDFNPEIHTMYGEAERLAAEKAAADLAEAERLAAEKAAADLAEAERLAAEKAAADLAEAERLAAVVPPPPPAGKSGK